MPLINWFNYGATDEEAAELQKLFFGGELITALRRLILHKHLNNVEFDENTYEIKDFNSDYGLVFRLKITTVLGTTNTVEFRFFFNCFISKFQFKDTDREAGLAGKDLSWANLLKLRILYNTFKQISFFSKDENASKICNKKTHVATAWTDSNNGSMGRAGVIN